MSYSVKDYNIDISENYNTSVVNEEVIVDTEKLFFTAAKVAEHKYTDAEKDLLSLASKSKFVPSIKISKTLVKHYVTTGEIIGGTEMSSFDVDVCNKSFVLGKNENELCKMLASVDEIKSIYIFDRQSFTEFWVELYECSEEAEDKVFGIYGSFLSGTSFKSSVELITFDETEIKKDTVIKADILLKRKG